MDRWLAIGLVNEDRKVVMRQRDVFNRMLGLWSFVLGGGSSVSVGSL